MSVIIGLGYESSVVSHSFRDGVLTVDVRGERWSTDERLWLCNILVDEFRGADGIDQILITSATAVPGARSDHTRKAPPARWEDAMAQCVADPA